MLAYLAEIVVKIILIFALLIFVIGIGFQSNWNNMKISSLSEDSH